MTISKTIGTDVSDILAAMAGKTIVGSVWGTEQERPPVFIEGGPHKIEVTSYTSEYNGDVHHLLLEQEGGDVLTVNDLMAVQTALTALVSGFKTESYPVLTKDVHLKYDLPYILRTEFTKAVGMVSHLSDGVVQDDQGNAIQVEVPTDGWAYIYKKGSSYIASRPITLSQVTSGKASSEEIRTYWKHQMLKFLVNGNSLYLSMGPRSRAYAKTLLEAWYADSKEAAIKMGRERQYAKREATRVYKSAKTGDYNDEALPRDEESDVTIKTLDGGTIKIKNIPANAMLEVYTGGQLFMYRRKLGKASLDKQESKELDAEFLKVLSDRGHLVAVT